MRALDHGVDRATHAYATFELIEGRPLDQWLERREQFDMKTAVRLMISVAEAVEAAHAFGVVHRDLKPSNILIARDEQPRVTDFGIARATGLPLDSRGRYTSRGSLAFMSPEHYGGRPESDAPTSDIYCLGGLLYWIMSGKLPNGHDIASAVRHLEHDAAPARSYPARVPPTLRAVCERALSHSPKHRHHSAGAFAEDLRAWLGHRSLTWTAPTPTTRARLFVRRNRTGAIATAAAVLTLMGAAGWVAATVQGANNEAAIQEERLTQAELASQLAISNERVIAQHDKITQANRMIRAWKDAIVQSGLMDPARYLSLLAVLGSSNLTDDALKSDILLDSLDASIKIADQAWASDQESLESWLWQLIAGVNLTNADRADEGRAYLERARDGLATVLAPDDPLLLRLREHLELELPATPPEPGV